MCEEEGGGTVSRVVWGWNGVEGVEVGGGVVERDEGSVGWGRDMTGGWGCRWSWGLMSGDWW